MTRPDRGFENSFHRSDVEKPSRRLLYAGVLCAFGIVLVILHLPHLVEDIEEGMGTLALMTGALFPLLLSISLVWAGIWLLRSDVPTDHLRRIDMWFLLGCGGILLVGGTVMVYQLLEGAQLTHLRYVLFNFTTAGGVVGVLIGWYDVQNRLRKEQLQVFHRVIEHSGHSIYFTDPAGIIEYVNPAFENQTGYDWSTAVGKTPRIMKSGEQDKEFYEEMWNTILSGEVWQKSLINERRDGTQHYVDQTIAPVTNNRGEIKHFVAINSDISELKAYQTELEQKNERLDEFAKVVSHDLRNPLNVASGWVEMARHDRETEELNAAKQALVRMERLIDDVLTLTRQGEMIGETASISLRDVCEAAWRQVESEDATLSIQTDRTVVADASRVQQLFENLFRNAIEHGGDNVRISVGDTREGFYVADTGTGFTDDALDRLFESGYSTTEGGTGLGLSIVRRIVEAHEWDITAMQGTDGGARFEISGLEK